LILAIESSCDETAAAIVERGARTLSSVVASQIATHARFGGVVPELASREHLRAIVPVVRAALAEAGVSLAELDAIAVTAGPGLAGALLVGITYAKALALATGLPLIAVNHLEGHIHAVLLNEREAARNGLMNSGSQVSDSRPFDGLGAGSGTPGGSSDADDEAALALVVSGGHTHLYLARPTDDTWHYKLIGRTLDDAAGEAFDKVAKLLGLGYPGGPWIDALARFGNASVVPFSFSRIKTKLHLGGKAPRTKGARTSPIAELDPRFLFSFSGIKTAVLRYVELHDMRAEAETRHRVLFHGAPSEAEFDAAGVDAIQGTIKGEIQDEIGETRQGIKRSAPVRPPQSHEEALALCPQSTLDLIASFQHAVVGDLMKKTFAAAESLGARRILVTGGVAANRELRARFAAEARRRGVSVSFPTLALSTDNAAMIGAAAWPRFVAKDFAAPGLSAEPSLALGR
jgi:N6-L-threonylcarbamoyladenine synthase